MKTDVNYINAEEFRILNIISEKYKNNEMSTDDMVNRTKFLHDYANIAREALKNMQRMETSL